MSTPKRHRDEPVPEGAGAELIRAIDGWLRESPNEYYVLLRARMDAWWRARGYPGVAPTMYGEIAALRKRHGIRQPGSHSKASKTDWATRRVEAALAGSAAASPRSPVGTARPSSTSSVPNGAGVAARSSAAPTNLDVPPNPAEDALLRAMYGWLQANPTQTYAELYVKVDGWWREHKCPGNPPQWYGEVAEMRARLGTGWRRPARGETALRARLRVERALGPAVQPTRSTLPPLSANTAAQQARARELIRALAGWLRAEPQLDYKELRPKMEAWWCAKGYPGTAPTFYGEVGELRRRFGIRKHGQSRARKPGPLPESTRRTVQAVDAALGATAPTALRVEAERATKPEPAIRVAQPERPGPAVRVAQPERPEPAIRAEPTDAPPAGGALPLAGALEALCAAARAYGFVGTLHIELDRRKINGKRRKLVVTETEDELEG
jgi:hypothetical protein